MSTLAIVHHSAHGHTAFIARHVLAGASDIEGIDARLLEADDVARSPDALLRYDEAANRLGSWSGLMAQAAHGAPAEAFAPGDVKTARMFGRHFARSLGRLAVPA